MLNHGTVLTTGRRLVAASVLLLATRAFGGYVYELSPTESSDAPGSRILVEGSKLKMALAGGSESDVVYDGASQELLIINHKSKSYIGLDKGQIDKFSKQLSDAMAQMEQQLANVPPAQRKMMEKMMKDRMPQMGEKIEVSVSRTGETETIAGYDTEKVEVRAGDTRQELWVVDWAELEGSEQISAGMEGMSELFSGMMSAMSQSPMGKLFEGQQANLFGQFKEIGGFPVRSREYDASGKLVSELDLKGIESVSIDASEFRAPKGYKRQKMGR